MKYISFILLLSLLVSCDLDLPEEAFEENAEVPLMQELSVPTGFDFRTSRNATLTVLAKDADGVLLRNVPFKIYLVNGTSLEESLTAHTGTDGMAEIQVSVPTATDSLLIQTLYLGLPAEKIVTVGNAEKVEVLLGEENQEGFKGDGENALFVFSNSSNYKNEAQSTQSVGNRSVVPFTYMGTYNNSGKPNYLVTPNDVVSQEVLDVINASLPEGAPVPTAHPEYLAADKVSTVNLIEDAGVWVTFVHEGAGYRNALGYYSYPTENPPATIDEIASLNIIFPNVSFTGSGGNLTTGNKVYLGTFTAGTSIGWFLVPDGWNNSTRKVDTKPGIKFSDKNLNTFTQAQYRQHVALLYDQSLQKLLLGVEDINRPGGDNDFNDAVFYVTANPFSAIETARLVAATNNDDDDNDGVSNAVDVAPNNPAIAFHAYTPSQGAYGTLAFEDLFPSQGDYDMNDLVVDYNFKEYLNAQNQVVKMDVSFRLRAAGGVQQNGFGFELGVVPGKIASVTGHQLLENIVKMAGNGTEAAQDKAVIIAFDNGLQLLGGGSIINTEKEKGQVDPVELDISVTFTQPVARQELGVAPFNPFLFVNTLRGKEVHLPGYHPTSLANEDFFGAADDATNPSNGVYYQTSTGLPFAINLPSSFVYPLERTPINKGHLKFTQWAQSGGTDFTDWYKNLSGYRANQKLY
ncbi:MAG: LruC domain-containing protein [Saprospiraceae bacterium]|nr:LruC domain-containing protein [Saprospiraceae bacterium]